MATRKVGSGWRVRTADSIWLRRQRISRATGLPYFRPKGTARPVGNMQDQEFGKASSTITSRCMGEGKACTGLIDDSVETTCCDKMAWADAVDDDVGTALDAFFPPLVSLGKLGTEAGLKEKSDDSWDELLTKDSALRQAPAPKTYTKGRLSPSQEKRKTEGASAELASKLDRRRALIEKEESLASDNTSFGHLQTFYIPMVALGDLKAENAKLIVANRELCLKVVELQNKLDYFATLGTYSPTQPGYLHLGTPHGKDSGFSAIVPLEVISESTGCVTTKRDCDPLQSSSDSGLTFSLSALGTQSRDLLPSSSDSGLTYSRIDSGADELQVLFGNNAFGSTQSFSDVGHLSSFSEVVRDGGKKADGCVDICSYGLTNEQIDHFDCAGFETRSPPDNNWKLWANHFGKGGKNAGRSACDIKQSSTDGGHSSLSCDGITFVGDRSAPGDVGSESEIPGDTQNRIASLEDKLATIADSVLKFEECFKALTATLNDHSLSIAAFPEQLKLVAHSNSELLAKVIAHCGKGGQFAGKDASEHQQSFSDVCPEVFSCDGIGDPSVTEFLSMAAATRQAVPYFPRPYGEWCKEDFSLLALCDDPPLSQLAWKPSLYRGTPVPSQVPSLEDDLSSPRDFEEDSISDGELQQIGAAYLGCTADELQEEMAAMEGVFSHFEGEHELVQIASTCLPTASASRSVSDRGPVHSDR